MGKKKIRTMPVRTAMVTAGMRNFRKTSQRDCGVEAMMSLLLQGWAGRARMKCRLLKRSHDQRERMSVRSESKRILPADTAFPRDSFGKIEAVASAPTSTRAAWSVPPQVYFLDSLSPLTEPPCPRLASPFYYDMALFSKRLTCFYCGRRPTQPTRGPVRKFHCDHCEADNYLDQVRFPKTSRKFVEILLTSLLTLF